MAEEQNGSGPSPGRAAGYFSEQETARSCRLEVQVIQHLVEAGVISGVEIAGEAGRCYDAADLALLRRARRLYEDLGVNLEGIEIIMHLEARIEVLQRALSRYQGMD